MKSHDLKRLPLLVAGLLLIALLTAFTIAGAPHTLELSWFTVDGGGNGQDCFSNLSGLRLCGTAGQPDAGAAQAGTFILNSGFWVGGRLAQYRLLLPLTMK